MHVFFLLVIVILTSRLLVALMSSPDVVVRIAAADAIFVCVDDFDFVLDDFLPFAEVPHAYHAAHRIRQCAGV